MSFQKIYGLYGLKHYTVDLLRCIVDPDFSCPRTDGLTDGRAEVFQEVLADLKTKGVRIPGSLSSLQPVVIERLTVGTRMDPLDQN